MYGCVLSICLHQVISQLFTLRVYAIWTRFRSLFFILIIIIFYTGTNGDRSTSTVCLSTAPLFTSDTEHFWPEPRSSGANGVVYMKCGGRTDDGEEAEPRRRPETRPDCSRGKRLLAPRRRRGGGAREENHNKSDVTRPCGWYE